MYNKVKRKANKLHYDNQFSLLTGLAGNSKSSVAILISRDVDVENSGACTLEPVYQFGRHSTVV